MPFDEQTSAEIQALLDWKPTAGKFLLGFLFGAAMLALVSIGIAAAGAAWFNLDRTQQCIVFAGSFIAISRLSNGGDFFTLGHVALAVKALAITSSRRP